jgi:hypothetical protein
MFVRTTQAIPVLQLIQRLDKTILLIVRPIIVQLSVRYNSTLHPAIRNPNRATSTTALVTTHTKDQVIHRVIRGQVLLVTPPPGATHVPTVAQTTQAAATHVPVVQVQIREALTQDQVVQVVTREAPIHVLVVQVLLALEVAQVVLIRAQVVRVAALEVVQDHPDQAIRVQAVQVVVRDLLGQALPEVRLPAADHREVVLADIAN